MDRKEKLVSDRAAKRGAAKLAAKQDKDNRRSSVARGATKLLNRFTTTTKQKSQRSLGRGETVDPTRGLTGSAGSAWGVYYTFISETAALQVNVSSVKRKAVHEALVNTLDAGGTPSKDIFDDSVTEVEKLMARDNLSRFIKSAKYLDLVEAKRMVRDAESEMQ